MIRLNTKDTPPEQRNDPKGNTSAIPSQLPIDLLLLSRQFPFKTVYEAEDAVRKRVRAKLPPKQVAYDSAYFYYSRLAWSCVFLICSIPLTHSFDSTAPNVWEEFLRYVFKPIYEESTAASDEQVAVLFIVLAVSMLMDLSVPPFHPDAAQYYHLSRISIILGEVIDRLWECVTSMLIFWIGSFPVEVFTRDTVLGAILSTHKSHPLSNSLCSNCSHSTMA